MSLGATCMARPAGSGQGQTPFPCPVRRRHPADAGAREAHSCQRPALRHRQAAGRGAGCARHAGQGEAHAPGACSRARSRSGTSAPLWAAHTSRRGDLLRGFGRQPAAETRWLQAMGRGARGSPWSGRAHTGHHSASHPACCTLCQPACRGGGAGTLARQRGGTRAGRPLRNSKTRLVPPRFLPARRPSHARPQARDQPAGRWAGRVAAVHRVSLHGQRAGGGRPCRATHRVVPSAAPWPAASLLPGQPASAPRSVRHRSPAKSQQAGSWRKAPVNCGRRQI